MAADGGEPVATAATVKRGGGGDNGDGGVGGGGVGGGGVEAL